MGISGPFKTKTEPSEERLKRIFICKEHTAACERRIVAELARREYRRGPTTEAELGGKEMSAILHREIRRMPPIFRSILVLRDLDELSMEDVAERLGISLAAAKSRLMRARAELRQRLEKQFGAFVRNLVPA